MNLYTIETGFFKLDGGAMFGVVPKSIWQRSNPADEKNLCTWAMRCLLIEDGDRLILIDTGIGDKQSEKFFSYFQPHGEDTLLNSLAKNGFGPDDITDVILTHLHFDHCGGAVTREGDARYLPTFRKARYWSHLDHWTWANQPNPREKASFLKENFESLEQFGQLHFLAEGNKEFDNISFMTVNGHTEKMIIPHIHYDGQTIVYMADLLPSAGHIPLPYVMGYDIRPLESLKEKKNFLEEAVSKEYILFFEHDPHNACATVRQGAKYVELDQVFPLRNIL